MAIERELGGVARDQSKTPPGGTRAEAKTASGDDKDSAMPACVKGNSHPGFTSVADWIASRQYKSIAEAAIAKEERRKRDRDRESLRRRRWRKARGLPTKAVPFCLIAFNVPTLLALPAKIEAKRYPEEITYPGQREPFENRQHRPQWMIDAERTVTIAPAGFRLLRSAMLRMTTMDCAAFLRVDVGTVERWESGAEVIPFAAYWLLHVTARASMGRDRFAAWDGWYVIEAGPDAGKLLDPRSTRCFTADEVAGIPRLWGQVFHLKARAEKLAEDLAAAQRENTRLRQTIQARTMTTELRAMQDRIGSLLDSIATADVVDFAPADRVGKLTRIA
jgi:DNA-binding transcriptional regulator YiaG